MGSKSSELRAGVQGLRARATDSLVAGGGLTREGGKTAGEQKRLASGQAFLVTKDGSIAECSKDRE